MRTLHILHFHKPDRHHLVQQLRQIFRDPLFWAILILAVILIAMTFFATARPTLPESQPYAPMYPYPG